MGATGAAVAAFAVIKPSLVRGTAANSTVNLGMIGCGGRGTWIAKLFKAHGGYNVVAAYDYFQDRADDLGNQVGVPEANRYTGLRAISSSWRKWTPWRSSARRTFTPSRPLQA